MLAALFLSACLLTALAAPADAAPRSKCRNNPENYSFYHGKCMSDKRIERLQDGEHGPNRDRRLGFQPSAVGFFGCPLWLSGKRVPGPR